MEVQSIVPTRRFAAADARAFLPGAHSEDAFSGLTRAGAVHVLIARDQPMIWDPDRRGTILRLHDQDSLATIDADRTMVMSLILRAAREAVKCSDGFRRIAAERHVAIEIADGLDAPAGDAAPRRTYRFVDTDTDEHVVLDQDMLGFVLAQSTKID